MFHSPYGLPIAVEPWYSSPALLHPQLSSIDPPAGAEDTAGAAGTQDTAGVNRC